ncbi:MAG TPA: response regulator [Anaeromyxobacter sp.]|nr:response regulator [Anaeromyxobacter sp.]
MRSAQAPPTAATPRRGTAGTVPACDPPLRHPRGRIILKKTGELVVERGLATPEQVEKALVEGRARGEPLCTRLLAAGVDEGELVSVLSEKHGVPGVDLSRTAIALELLDLIPRAVAEGDLILPLSLEGDRLHLAMARPNDERVLAEVRFVTGLEASPYVACRGALLRDLNEAYAARARGVQLWRGNACVSGTPHIEAAIGGADVVDATDEIPDAEIVIEIETEPAAPERQGKGPVVLVVDDEAEIRKLVEKTLVSKGYEVVVAQDGADGLEKAERLAPDLVLLDAMLPKVHGFEACRRIKASPRTRHVPVVMMTAIFRGWRFAQDAKESYGAVDYIEKPFRLDDLLRRVEAALLSGGAPTSEATDEGALDPRVRHAKELLAAGRIAEAICALSEAVHADPHSADAQFQLGRALKAGGDAFGAMTALERAAELATGHLAALRALATVYEETGFRRKAAEVLERALPAAPDDAARSAIRRDLLRLIA